MRKLDSIIFDLDGTFWDTCTSCAIGWNNVLLRNRIPFRKIEAADVRGVAGKPHEDCIRTVFSGLTESQLLTLINETSKEDNEIVAKLGGDLYPGVATGLRDLSRRFPLYIVSNCQAGYIETFLQWSGLRDVFQDFECWGNTGRPKAENIQTIIERNRLTSPAYVGDTEGDRAAARKCGIPFFHVTYGFGSCSEADGRFDLFTDLAEALAGLQEIKAPDAVL